jgi:hypothetical protein
MSVDKEKPMIYRCPVCFSRENDVPLFRDDRGYYCVKCSFTGTKEDILEMYGDLKKKFQNRRVRYTIEEQRKL